MHTKLPNYEELETYAVQYANAQPLAEWAAAKKGYMAGAQDWMGHQFSRLEMASLEAMKGIMAGRQGNLLREEYRLIAESSVLLAKAVLEEANK